MSINVKASGEIIQTINGEIIADAGFKSDYDGKKMKIKGYSDGKQFYTELDPKDIQKILATPSHQTSLEERLIKDYGSRKGQKKSTKQKKVKGKNKKHTRKHAKK